MIAVTSGNVTRLHAPETRIADIVPPGKRLVWRCGGRDAATAGPGDAKNARRDAEYRKRLSGDKPALLQLWRA